MRNIGRPASSCNRQCFVGDESSWFVLKKLCISTWRRFRNIDHKTLAHSTSDIEHGTFEQDFWHIGILTHIHERRVLLGKGWQGWLCIHHDKMKIDRSGQRLLDQPNNSETNCSTSPVVVSIRDGFGVTLDMLCWSHSVHWLESMGTPHLAPVVC